MRCASKAIAQTEEEFGGSMTYSRKDIDASIRKGIYAIASNTIAQHGRRAASEWNETVGKTSSSA